MYRSLFLVRLIISGWTVCCYGETDSFTERNPACWLMVVNAVSVTRIEVILMTCSKKKMDALVQRNVHSVTGVTASISLPGERDSSFSINFESICLGQVWFDVNIWMGSGFIPQPP